MNHDSLYVVAGSTHPGLMRAVNEDGFYIDELRGLYVVADGMGGHADGAIASGEALAHLATELSHINTPRLLATPSTDRINTLRHALNNANQTLYAQNIAAGAREGRGMGAAIAGIWVGTHGEPATLFHVGDCRIYVWRGGELTRLTSDHSVYQQWVDRGAVGTAPDRNVLLRCIGPHPEVEPELQSFHLQKGDRCLVCSDGLTTMLSDEDLAWLMAESSAHPINVACQRFINEANDRGGLDNVTVVLINVRG